MISGSDNLAKSQLFSLNGEAVEETVRLERNALSNLGDSRQLDGLVIDQKYQIICLLGE